MVLHFKWEIHLEIVRRHQDEEKNKTTKQSDSGISLRYNNNIDVFLCASKPRMPNVCCDNVCVWIRCDGTGCNHTLMINSNSIHIKIHQDTLIASMIAFVYACVIVYVSMDFKFMHEICLCSVNVNHTWSPVSPSPCGQCLVTLFRRIYYEFKTQSTHKWNQQHKNFRIVVKKVIARACMLLYMGNASNELCR